MATIKVTQLLDKDIFVSNSVKSVNVRRNTSVNSDLLASIKRGERIGKVYTWAYGLDAKNNKDETQIWLQLYEKYNNPSGFGAWVKLAPYILDTKSLRDQGVKTTAEQTKEEEDKKKNENMTWFDKLGEGVKSILPWVAVVYIGGKAIQGREARPKTNK